MSAAAQYLAWKSIAKEAEPLNLDAFGRNQATTKVKDFDSTVDLRIDATFIWGLAPRQADPTSEVEWEEFKVAADGTLAEKASQKFSTEWVFRSKLSGVELRGILDKYLWAERDHVSVAQLAEWFARYLYLPRLTNAEVLERAVIDGDSVLNPEDTFAVAGRYDEAKKRYSGMKVGEGVPAVVDRTTLVVKTPIARAQREKERAPSTPPNRHDSGEMVGVGGKGGVPQPGAAPKLPPNVFRGSVKLDALRVVKDAARILTEVVEHVSTLPDAETEVTLEIRVAVPDGVKEDVIRTVTENAKTLKFQSFSFERE